jgi:UDP-N-acetylmuramoylalanine-D-glutamate ligase
MYNDSKISGCIITDGANLDELFKAVRSLFSSCFEIVVCANGNYENVKDTFKHYSKFRFLYQCFYLLNTISSDEEIRDFLMKTTGKKGAKVVLLSPACASFDQYQSFEHRGDHFRQLCLNLS